MTQTVPATCVLGPGKTGLTIGLRVLNLDGTVYAAFSTTGVAETSTAGTYRKAGGVVAPLAGGYIVWGVAGTDYAEATVESASANVTLWAGQPTSHTDGTPDVNVKWWLSTPVVPPATEGIPTVDMEGASIRLALGLGSNNLDTQLAALPTAVEIVAAMDADPPAVNVTMQQGVAVAAADVTGYINVLSVLGNVDGTVGEVTNLSLTAQQAMRDAMKLAPTAGAPAAGSVDKHLDDLSAAGDPWSTALPGAYGAGTAGALLSGIDGNVDLLLAADTSTSDATTAGAISRRRGNSWAIPLTIGAITGYTSLWFTIKSSYDDVDTAALVQIKLNSPSASDGLLYVNGTTASSAALGSITVSDATTGAIVVNVDETITDDLAPGTYYYDVQTLIAGAVATPDSGVFTVTADVTRSVA